MPDKEHAAVRVIKRYWQKSFSRKTTTKLVDIYQKSGATSVNAKSVSVENLTILLRKKTVITATKACLHRVNLLCSFRHGCSHKALTVQNGDARVFLTGLIIAYHPTHAFETAGAMQHSLQQTATQLFAAFDDIITSIRANTGFVAVPFELTSGFLSIFIEYLKRMTAWRQSTFGRINTEQLAHELLLDPTFQLDEGGRYSIDNPGLSRIQVSFKQAFWDSLVGDLQRSIPCYVRALSVLAEIRDGVKDVTNQATPIMEIVNLDHIWEQADAGRFSWSRRCKLISSIMAIIMQVLPPHRCEETRTMWVQIEQSLQAPAEEQPQVFCKALEFLLSRVNLLRIDTLNARIRVIAPVIKDHGIEYERSKFQAKLNAGTLTLERTTAWIEHFSSDAEFNNTVKYGIIIIHANAMLFLITSKTAIKPETVPETLLFDIHRLISLQREFSTLVEAATMLATAKAAVGEGPVLREIASLFVWVKEIDLKATVNAIVEKLRVVNISTPRLAQNLYQCVSPVDVVHTLM